MAYGVNAPFGLRPLSSINGGSWTEKTNTYYISAPANGVATYATSIFTGDPVIWNTAIAAQGGGTIARYGFNTDGNAGTNNVSIVGVFMGCEYTLPTGAVVKASYWPAATAVMPGSKIKALVIDDPSAVFDVQVSTWTNVVNDARFPYGLMGQNFGLGLGGGGGNLVPINPADGSTRTGQSGAYLAGAFTANNVAHTVITLPLKVIGYTNDPNNLNNPISYVADATTAPFLNVMVTINNHAYRGGSLGVVAA
ncbi:MAG TPA: hypothetical protein VMV86_01590 [Methanosarcinales archaeon]|nr:hypothetical protein [Methanosarcinales archaeon]